PKSIDGYLNVQADTIDWVKLIVASGGAVSGQWIATNGQKGAGTQTIYTVTGIFQEGNNAISLTLQGPQGVTINASGTFENSMLSVDIQQGSAVKHKVLTGAAESDYAAALATFEKKYPLATPAA
ncbi:MAG TPA: hypothetical protein VGN34_29995, partial [Ktedonobacteraceae bacterium]